MECAHDIGGGSLKRKPWLGRVYYFYLLGSVSSFVQFFSRVLQVFGSFLALF